MMRCFRWVFVFFISETGFLGIALSVPSAAACQVLGLQVSATTPGSCQRLSGDTCPFLHDVIAIVISPPLFLRFHCV